MENEHTDTRVEFDDGASPLRYFAAVPNLIDDLDLSPYAVRLYLHYVRVCGSNPDGYCSQGTRTIAERCGMSVGKVSDARAELERDHDGVGPLIRVESWTDASNRPRLRIRLANLWPENIRRYCSPDEQSPFDRSHDERYRSPDERYRSPDERYRSPDERYRSPDEHKKNQVKKNPDKKNPAVRDREKAVLARLNELTGAKYSASKELRGRIADGATDEDLIAVVEHKFREWWNNPGMAAYVRPETLFRAGKFAGYVQQARVAKRRGLLSSSGSGSDVYERSARAETSA